MFLMIRLRKLMKFYLMLRVPNLLVCHSMIRAFEVNWWTRLSNKQYRTFQFTMCLCWIARIAGKVEISRDERQSRKLNKEHKIMLMNNYSGSIKKANLLGMRITNLSRQPERKRNGRIMTIIFHDSIIIILTMENAEVS